MLSTDRAPFEGHYANVYTEPNTGCWLWPGPINGGGYGLAEYMGRQELAHRASFHHSTGSLSPQTKVLHTCDVPLCVNPDHLYAGTQAQNMADMKRRGRHVGTRGKRGAWKRPDTKVSDDQVRQIRGDSRLLRVIASSYGISASLASAIRRGKRRTNL